MKGLIRGLRRSYSVGGGWVRGKRGKRSLEEALLGVLGGLLGNIKAKVLVTSASSGAHS